MREGRWAHRFDWVSVGGGGANPLGKLGSVFLVYSLDREKGDLRVESEVVGG